MPPEKILSKPCQKRSDRCGKDFEHTRYGCGQATFPQPFRQMVQGAVQSLWSQGSRGGKFYIVVKGLFVHTSIYAFLYFSFISVVKL